MSGFEEARDTNPQNWVWGTPAPPRMGPGGSVSWEHLGLLSESPCSPHPAPAVPPGPPTGAALFLPLELLAAGRKVF